MEVLYIVFLALAVSFDSFIAGATYGVRKITLPATSLLVLGGITAVCTWAAMLLAAFFGDIIDPHIAAAIGAALLLAIGLFSLFQEYLVRRITPFEANASQPLTIRVGKLLINIMADPEACDFDHSKSISPGEAVMLGFALGLDNMAATFAASLLGILPFYTPIVMGLFQMLLIWLGVHIGARYVPDRLSAKFPYFPGALLVVMGITRLVK